MAITSFPTTTCEECGTRVVLDTAEEALDGGECSGCGYYVTRYTPEFRQEADWL